MRRARLRSAAVGVKAWLITGTWSGMNCEAAREPVVAGRLAGKPQARGVAEINVNRVDGLDRQCMSGENALRSRVFIGRPPSAVRQSRIACAKGGA